MKTGFKDYRLIEGDRYHEKELKAVEVFNRDHLKDADFIVFGQKGGAGLAPNDFLTEREEKIVLSVIQWCGTPVGQSFLKEIE